MPDPADPEGVALFVFPATIVGVNADFSVVAAVDARCEAVAEAAKSVAVREGARYGYVVSNRSDTIRARGFVKPLNAAARLDNEENATLLKAIASVGPTERGDPPPSQDYPAESYQRLAGRTDGIRVRSRTCGRSDRPGRRGRRGRLLRRRERIGQTLIPMTNPVPERDPGSRPRLDPQAMNERDAAIAKLLARGWSYRAIAAQLHCSLGTVTKAVTRLREGPRPPRPWTRPKPVHRGGPFGDRTDDNW